MTEHYAFIVKPPEVLKLSIAAVLLEDREATRKMLLKRYEAKQVYFIDEAYTDKDPFLGPKPKYKPTKPARGKRGKRKTKK